MKPTIARVLRRLTAGRQPDGPPPTDGLPSPEERVGPPAMAAWRAVDVRDSGAGWEVTLEPPSAQTVASVLVLVGRSNNQELVTPMDVGVGTVVATLSPAALTVLADDRVDLWVETVGGEDRRRVATGSVDPERSSVPDLRWYSTVKGNLSAVLGPSVLATPAASPVLATLVPGATGTEVVLLSPEITLDSPDAEQPAGAVLVLAGRRRRRAIGLNPTSESGRWRAVVENSQLEGVRSDQVDLYVESAVAARTSIRRRLSAGVQLPESPPGSPWRWYVDERRGVSVRTPTAREVIVEVGVFDEDFYRSQVPELPTDVDPLDHYLVEGADQGLDPCRAFDTDYYRSMNSTIRRRNPLAHYCQIGWRELLNPSPSFDTWWYWSKHLDPADASVIPMAHYETVGRELGLSTHPSRFPSRNLRPGHRLDVGRPVRRVCLFAAYDPDGIVDDYVVDYVRELARHADVYYLADSVMQETELAKLSDLTCGAWGIRHGEYDFGSYARLVEMVGWPTLEQYDELLLVNDSSYLLRPLDDVFSRMDARPCDWWGLQATKGIYATRNVPANAFPEPIAMERVRTSLLDAFETDYRYDFLVGSYFLAYRQPVLRDPEFRRYLAAVTTQAGKRAVVLRYEVGMTRWLIQHGHAFDTFLAYLYPFHPVYTMWYFRLLDEGFPLLKRFLLSENHYRVPDLWRWPELIRTKVPGADIAAFQRNLDRVVDAERLQQNLHVVDPRQLDPTDE